MFEIVPYSIWNTATGEVYATGRSVEGGVSMPDGYAIYWGERVDYETHVFNEHGVPVLRDGPRPLTAQEISVSINRERQRRIELGKSFGGVWVTGSDKDIMNLTNLALGAQLRIAIGDATLTTFRDGNNVDHDLAPMEIIGLWQVASAYVSALYQASWALKAMDPIPQDIANPVYWE